jgi:protein-disulfide isomerase
MKTTAFFACAVAFVAIAGCNSKQGNAATNAPVKLEQVKPPKGGDWTQVVNPTPDGGFMMGNPNAKVKLIEIGSLTCPHCKAFEDEGVPTLMNTYVKSGRVSWQFRNYVRDAFDLTAALIVRCNGAKSFFPLTQAMYKDQEQWIAKIQAAPQDKLQQLQSLPENQQFVELAKVAGFPEWAAMRGVPLAKSAQCLSNTKLIDQVVQMNSETTNQFPAFEGTPTFAINGAMVPKVAAWEGLEPEIKKALGKGG